MTTLFNRLGNLGVLLIAVALLLGGLAGAAVVHHYDKLSADTVAAPHGDKGKGAPQQKKQHGNQKGLHKGHQPGNGSPQTD